jgi:hypothetical protein
MALYVGLDVSLKTISICIIEADGTPVWEGKAESEPVPLIKTLRVGKRKLHLSALRLAHSRNGSMGRSWRAAFMPCALRHAMRSDSCRHARTRQTVAMPEASPT